MGQWVYRDVGLTGMWDSGFTGMWGLRDVGRWADRDVGRGWCGVRVFQWASQEVIVAWTI